MAQRVYVVMDGKGKPLGFGTKIEAVAAAEKHASGKGGIAVLQEPDPRDAEKVENPPPPPEAMPTDAYRFTGLPEICQQKYGQEYLDINLVESISLKDALRLCRPHLPQAAKYDRIDDKLLGGPGVDLLAENVDGKPTHNSFGLLGRNAKLAKSDSPDGRTALAFGLSLAPFQSGLRLSGKSTPRGWEPPKDFGNKAFGDRIFKQGNTDVADGLSKLAGTPVNDVRAGHYTVCRLSSPDCRSSCLVHSGQNAASIEALTSKLCLTRALYAEPAAFCRLLLENLRRFFTWGGCGDLDLYVRLNVFSDIPWELFFPDLIDPFKKVALRAPDGREEGKYPTPVRGKGGKWQNANAYLERPITGHGSFYDYTKIPARMEIFADGLSMVHKKKKADVLAECKSYYHLTFSFSGKNEGYAKWHLDNGGKVAVVFVQERLERHGGELVKAGVQTVDIVSGKMGREQVRQMLRLPRDTPAEDLTILGQLLDYADDGSFKPTGVLGKWLKASNLRLPPETSPSQRTFWATELASVLGYSFSTDQFRKSVSTEGGKQLRGQFEKSWFYDFKFTSGPFTGYPVINADRNDLRAKDDLVMRNKFGEDKAALVGLDFKVAKIRIATDEYAVVMQKHDKEGKKRKGEYEELGLFSSEEEAEEALRTGSFPKGAFVRRLGELVQVKLDLEKNSFVTPVYKEGDVFYVAQIPSQTMDGSQEHG